MKEIASNGGGAASAEEIDGPRFLKQLIGGEWS
jgi:hypothetical protein